MNKAYCLYCYKLLQGNQIDFHSACSRNFFGTSITPTLEFEEDQIRKLALQSVQSHVTVPGVQAKISVDLEKVDGAYGAQRFTIVGVMGNYILKPQSTHYHQLPENEDLTMHLAEIAKIRTVPHCLIRLHSGNLAYITRRIDRERQNKHIKIHMEDMCQLTERLTEDKYKGSYEQIAKTILKYSVNPILDTVDFYELVAFSFLTGNADMHLKNFSLIDAPEIGYHLSPAYDLVSSKLVLPSDEEDMALTLNGKKSKITGRDFMAAFETAKLEQVQQKNIIKKMSAAMPKWLTFIDSSFLDEEMKAGYKDIISEKMQKFLAY